MFKHFLKGLLILGCVVMSVPVWATDEENRTTTPTETKFYRIKSAYSGFTATKMVYANGHNMAWKTLDADDPTSVWLFTPGSDDNKYKMRNAFTGLYQQTRTGDSQPYLLGTSEPEVTIHQIGETQQVYITNTRAMHAEGWSGGNAGNVVSWQTSGTLNSASAWYIESIDEDDAVLDNLKEHYRSSIAHLSASNQAKFADELAVINNSASTPAQIVDTYVAIQEKLAKVISFTQITSEYMLQTGGKYVVGVIGTNATAWLPRNPLCYKANPDGTTFDFVAKPNLDFTSDLIWTATVNPSYVCDNTTTQHNGPHKVLQLTQDINGTAKAIKLDANQNGNKIMAATNDVSTNIEFVPIEAEAFADELLFQWHIHPSNLTHFQQIHAVNPNGGIGFYSRASNVWVTNLLGGDAGLTNSYSGLNRVYMVIDSEDFPGAAEAIWKALKEEECAASMSEDYMAQVNALPVPDISAYTNASTFIDDLRKEFHKELFYLNSDYTATITPLTVTYNTGNATGWNHTLLDTKGAFAKIIAHNGTSEGLAGNITKIDDTTFDFRNGQTKRSRYEVECFNPAFSIIGVSFKASTEASGEYVTVDGEDILLTSTPKTIISTTATFEFHGNNQKVKVTDFKIKYRRTNAESATPSQSGWYSILNTHNIDTGANVLDFYAGKWVVNLERDVKQSNTNYYCLGVSDSFDDAPASNLIYIEVNNETNRYFRSSNGHYVSENGTSSRTRGTNTRVRDYSEDYCGMTIGNYWNRFTHTVDDETHHLIGQGGNGSKARWAVFKENPEELYDIWTVHITGAPAASAIQDDVRVQCTNAANKGLGKVFNNGNFFFTKGTTVTANDFVADALADASKNPIITINNAQKTINVAYYSKEEVVTLYKATVESGYEAYSSIDLFDQEVIDEIVEAHKAQVDIAAGEDDVISEEEIAALDAATASATFTAGYKQIRLTAAGKLVQFRNKDHNTLYLSVAPVSEGSTSYRAVGETDNTALKTLWQLELADAEQGTMYLKNYGTGLWMQNYVRTGNLEADIPASESNPVPFVVEAYLIGSGSNRTPVVGFKDIVSSNYPYLHQVINNGNRLVKWNTPATSDASGWTVMLADDDAISDNFEVSFDKTVENGHVMVLTHRNGVALHDAYFDTHHSIIIRKVEAGMRRVQARDGEGDEVSNGDITVTPDKLVLDDSEGRVYFPINENDALEEGQTYVATIPAGIVKIGAAENAKISKATTHTFTYTRDITTGIVEVGDSADGDVIYDLQGRRLTKPVHGINIVNGRKILVK